MRQVTWLCGDQPVLIEEVLRIIRWSLKPEPHNSITLYAGQDSDRVIWTELDTAPMGHSQNRLIVIRDAEKIQKPERLIEWIQHRRESPRTFVVLISNDERIARTEPTEESPKGEMVPHIAAISGKGHIVECRQFTASSGKVAIEWVKTKIRTRDGAAEHLLNRANGDLRLVRDQCAKLSLFPGIVGMHTINELMAAVPADEFVQSLLALKRKEAIEALVLVAPDDYARVLGMLDAQLDFAGQVHDMQMERKSDHEMRAILKEKSFLLSGVLPVAKHYNVKRRIESRQALAMADAALRGGNRVGIMETVVTLW